MEVFLVDGTYELFRHFHALPRAKNSEGQEVAAVRGVLRSILGMMQAGRTHIGVATDHVIESFRNELWPGYKTGKGIEPELLSQFLLLEEALTMLGVMVWPMVEFEADDALAAAAAKAEQDSRVERIVICTPDKDLGQCVRGARVVQLDRRRNLERNEAGVIAKFGVSPRSIPDYLALVGDAADGYPGLPTWGAKSTAAVLWRYGHIENVPTSSRDWQVPVSAAAGLAASLQDHYDLALLFRDLATLRTEIEVFDSVDQLLWRGPTPAFEELGKRLDAAVTEKVPEGTRKRLKRPHSAIGSDLSK